MRTALPARDRYALAVIRDDRGGKEPCQETLRVVIQAGLDAMGWPEDKRILEYADYESQCVVGGYTNEFESR